MTGMTFDRTKKEYIDTPKKMKDFFSEIEAVCRKYGVSIAYEDEFGGFVIEDYKQKNIDWLFAAAKNYPDRKRDDRE